jgi:predicted MPP superfamily phosphohydrolase
MSGFFGMVLAVYVMINAYLFVRLYSTLAGSGALRLVVCAAVLALAACFPAARIMGGAAPASARHAAALAGSLYIAPMLYGFLFALAADAFRLLNGVVAITRNPPPYSLGVRIGAVALIIAMSVLVTVAGALNANSPAVVQLDVALDDASDMDMKIAVISDIHLGAFTGPRYARKLAALVNAQFPDVVLIVGDIIDSEEFFGDLPRVGEAAAALASLRPRLGTWAVLGNHDHYAGTDRTADFLASADVRLLRDEAAPVGGIILAGRDDRTADYYGPPRRSLADILSPFGAEMASGRPVVLMDHQPFGLEEAERAGVALQVSGHTHRGQLWPINFVVAALYEKSYGAYKKGSTNYYITSGAGVWGPPARTIGRPEIVIINLRGGGKDGYDKWKTTMN